MNATDAAILDYVATSRTFTMPELKAAVCQQVAAAPSEVYQHLYRLQQRGEIVYTHTEGVYSAWIVSGLRAEETE